MIPLNMKLCRAVKLMETESRMVVVSGWGWGGGEWGVSLMGAEFQVGKIKKFWRWMVVMVAQKYE